MFDEWFDQWYIQYVRRRRRVARFKITVTSPHRRRKKEHMAQNTFTDGTNLLFTIGHVEDNLGNPDSFQAPPVWSVDNTTLLPSVTAAADGMTATGSLVQSGTGTVVVTAVGDSVTETVTLNVIAGSVASFTVTVTAVPPVVPAA